MFPFSVLVNANLAGSMQEKEKHISTTFIFASSSSRQYDDEPFKATYLNILLYGFVQLIFYKILFLYSSNSTYICLSVDANHFSIFQESVLLNFIWLFIVFWKFSSASIWKKQRLQLYKIYISLVMMIKFTRKE